MPTHQPVLLRFKFDKFADLPSEVDEDVTSEIQIDCNGKSWYLILYPGGDSRSGEGLTSLYLQYDGVKSDLPFDAVVSFAVKDSKKFDAFYKVDLIEFSHEQTFRGYDLMHRSEILDNSKGILRDGALCIDVTIQVQDSTGEDGDLYDPSDNYIKNKMLELLDSQIKSDISFNVRGEIFPAHSMIIHNNAPVIGKYCDEHEKDGVVIINDVPPDAFKPILDYVYFGCRPNVDAVLEMGKEIIDAANRYELVNLKLAVETDLVRHRVLRKDNVADYILFADAQSCALLKEYAISYFLLCPR
jgi:speckle-type POZ protein